MATLETICNMIETMKALYPQYLKNAEIRQTATAWLAMFEDVPDADFIPAFKKALKKATFPPTPADVYAVLDRAAATAMDVNPAAEWERLLTDCERVNDLRCDFGYTYVPEGSNKSQGDMARDKARALFEAMPECLREYCGSYSGFLQIAQEIGGADSTGLQIRRREYYQSRKEDVAERGYTALPEGYNNPALPE